MIFDPKKRLGANDALSNNKIMVDFAELAKKDSITTLNKFKEFNAKRKCNASFKKVIIDNELSSVVQGFQQYLE